VTKPFFKREDATIYYNYSEWPSRSCNFRKSLGKPRPFLYLPRSSSGGKAADIFCRNKREEKRTGSGRREKKGERGGAKGRAGGPEEGK